MCLQLYHTYSQLVKEYGILASPNPKPGRSLDPEVLKSYYNDCPSRVMPGKKKDHKAV
jgi:hypothetical protein